MLDYKKPYLYMYQNHHYVRKLGIGGFDSISLYFTVCLGLN